MKEGASALPNPNCNAIKGAYSLFLPAMKNIWLTNSAST